MGFEDVLKEAEQITVKRASELTGRSGSVIRWQLQQGRLVGRRIGNQWVIPVLYDRNGEPVFFAKYPKGGDDD